MTKPTTRLKNAVCIMITGIILANPFFALAQSNFNPNFIISDTEMQDWRSWGRNDVQLFLDSRGSYLRNFQTEDASGTVKSASDIIYEAAERYEINPKYILVTLQKEQSLVLDDTPTQRQLDWAAGYGVCDSCSMEDPNIQRHKGFGRQVDNAAGVIRWYYQNNDRSYIRKKDTPTIIDSQEVVPGSWATAFLYTYTPHFNGNRNFWRIWNTWFSQVYPDGTIFKSASTSEYWLLQEGKRRRFASIGVLIGRADPRMAVTVPDIELSNYEAGAPISYANYSILQTSSSLYLVDYDSLRPFESAEIVRQLGYNPQEFIAVTDEEIASTTRGSVITASTTQPQGIIYQITDRNNNYYLLKDNTLYPILDRRIVDLNYDNLRVERHRSGDLTRYAMADQAINFKEGALIRAEGMNKIYVVEHGKKRPIADSDTFNALGYKESQVATIGLYAYSALPEGEPLYLNSSLLSSRAKFLGDSLTPVLDRVSTTLPSYLIAEYPSGRIISGKNTDARRSIASLTKLLTAYQVMEERVNLNNGTVYRKSRHSSYGNPMRLQDGEKIRNNDLLHVLLINSANNTARMLAQSAGVNEQTFISRINHTLSNWGADDTAIVDVTGLEEGNKSTPRDLLKIFTRVLANNTLKTILGKSSYSFREMVNKNRVANHTFRNTNELMRAPNRNYKILASKTGYTTEAGATMLMLIESKVDRKQYIILTMGETNYRRRFNEPNKLAKWMASGEVQITGVRSDDSNL